jgi:hypothetical protein
MPDPKDTNQAIPENRPDAEAAKKPTQTIHKQGKPNTQPTVVPNPQDQEQKEPEKKRA